MKSEIKASVVQFSPRPMREKKENVRYILEQIDQLVSAGNELISFPELTITNFFEHEKNGRETYWNEGTLDIDDPLITTIQEAAIRHGVYVVVGFAERGELVGKVYNSVMLTGPNGLIGITRKMHLPGLEKLYFSSAMEIPVWDTPIGKIGISICYDSMFMEYLRILALKGAEIIIMSSSIWKGGEKGGIGPAKSKEQFWDQLPLFSAVTNQTFVLANNGGGSHFLGQNVGVWERLGLSKIVSPLGTVLARCEDNEDAILTATLKQEELVQARNVYSFLIDRMPYKYNELNL